jgi:hypothetical protein
MHRYIETLDDAVHVCQVVMEERDVRNVLDRSK